MLCHKCNVWYDGGDPKYCPRCAEEIESDAEQKIDTILAKPGTFEHPIRRPLGLWGFTAFHVLGLLAWLLVFP